MYLKRAALNRLNARLSNKKEELQAPLRSLNISVDDLEESTLSVVERFHLVRWFHGSESGRACLLALLDYRKQVEMSVPDSDKLPAFFGKGSNLELSLLSSSINLPENFLCNSSYLYQRIFSKSPVTVIREALTLLAEKAQESSFETMSVDQLTMALKQLRVENLAQVAVEADEAAAAAANAATAKKVDDYGDAEVDADRENSPPENDKNSSSSTHTAKAKDRMTRVKDEELRLQIIVELLRLHVAAANPGDPSSASVLDLTADTDQLPEQLLAADVQTHLRVPLSRQEERAVLMGPDALERSNTLLKPYIHQLAALRSSLTQQLRVLEENAAFISLGLDPCLGQGLSSGEGPTDAQIKRAYHAMAVRLHPDKGGDTAQFQALQDAYQEVLKKKKEKDAAKAALNRGLEETDGEAGGNKHDGSGAQHIVELVAAGVAVLRQAASSISSLAQRNLRLLRDVEKAATGSETADAGDSALKRLQKLLGVAEDGLDLSDDDDDNDDDDDATISIDSDGSDNSLSRWMREMDKREPKLSIDKERNNKSKRKGQSQSTVPTHDLPSLCAVHSTKPLEVVCEHLQLMAARAMELPGCGSRYAMATARCQPFIAGVEKCMAAGLAALKTTSSLGLADAQVSSSVLRLQFAGIGRAKTKSKTSKTKLAYRSKSKSTSKSKSRREKGGVVKSPGGSSDNEDLGDLAFLCASDSDSDCISDYDFSEEDNSEYEEDEEEEEEEIDEDEVEFQAILVEMVVTAVRSCSVTVNIAAERALAAVVTATELHNACVDIVSGADRDRQDEAQRRADVEEAEGQFCAEDRELMREMKSKQAADDKAKNDAARAQAKTEEEQKRAKEEAEDAADPSGLVALTRLKGQIQSLHVQLHLQHVKTLHALNAEARGLQQQLLGRVRSLPVPIAEHGPGGGRGGKKRAWDSPADVNSTDQSPSTGSSGLCTPSGILSSPSISPHAGMDDGPSSSSATASGFASADIVVLLAELVDASFSELRLAQMSASLDIDGNDDGDVDVDDDDESCICEGQESEARTSALKAREGALMGLIREHLGWLLMAAVPGDETAHELKTALLVGGGAKVRSGSGTQVETKCEFEAEPGTMAEPGNKAEAEAEAVSETKAETPVPEQEQLLPPPPLALLPDHRTRALLMAVLLPARAPAAKDLVHTELRERLVGLAVTAYGSAKGSGVEAADGNGRRAQRERKQRERAVRQANAFVDAVLSAADAHALASPGAAYQGVGQAQAPSNFPR